MDKENQKIQLRNLSKTSGWSIMELRINEQITTLRNQLENDSQVDTKVNQNQIKAYKTVIRWVEESSKGREKDVGT